MGHTEKLRRNETPLYKHTTKRLVDKVEVKFMLEAAMNNGFNLKIIANAGEQYSALFTSTEKVCDKKEIDKNFNNNLQENPTPKVVPEGKVYVSLVRFSHREKDLSIIQLDQDIRALKKAEEPVVIHLNLGL